MMEIPVFQCVRMTHDKNYFNNYRAKTSVLFFFVPVICFDKLPEALLLFHTLYGKQRQMVMVIAELIFRPVQCLPLPHKNKFESLPNTS